MNRLTKTGWVWVAALVVATALIVWAISTP